MNHILDKITICTIHPLCEESEEEANAKYVDKISQVDWSKECGEAYAQRSGPKRGRIMNEKLSNENQRENEMKRGKYRTKPRT